MKGTWIICKTDRSIYKKNSDYPLWQKHIQINQKYTSVSLHSNSRNISDFHFCFRNHSAGYNYEYAVVFRGMSVFKYFHTPDNETGNSFWKLALNQLC